MNDKSKSFFPFLLGVGITVGSFVLLGAAAPEEAKTKTEFSTQLVPIAGGLAMMLVVTDHETDHLYVYQMQNEKEGGKVVLKGDVDLSATGKEELPGKMDM